MRGILPAFMRKRRTFHVTIVENAKFFSIPALI